MERWPWIERRFDFDYPPAKFPELFERFRGTPARLEERLRGVTEEIASRSDGGWTIKQNVGHITDVEHLATQRLEEIMSGKPVLAAADMTNRKTNEASHDARPLSELLADLRQERMAAVAQFERVKPADWRRSSLHPRLQQPMRIVDILCFLSEHDDYHLGRIAELLRKFGA